jgi:hypothetical protein
LFSLILLSRWSIREVHKWRQGEASQEILSHAPVCTPPGLSVLFAFLAVHSYLFFELSIEFCCGHKRCVGILVKPIQSLHRSVTAYLPPNILYLAATRGIMRLPYSDKTHLFFMSGTRNSTMTARVWVPCYPCLTAAAPSSRSITTSGSVLLQYH